MNVSLKRTSPFFQEDSHPLDGAYVKLFFHGDCGATALRLELADVSIEAEGQHVSGLLGIVARRQTLGVFPEDLLDGRVKELACAGSHAVVTMAPKRRGCVCWSVLDSGRWRRSARCRRCWRFGRVSVGGVGDDWSRETGYYRRTLGVGIWYEDSVNGLRELLKLGAEEEVEDNQSRAKWSTTDDGHGWKKQWRKQNGSEAVETHISR